MKKSLGIYVHTPFCKKKCAYCDFHSKCGDKKDMTAYAKALCMHIEESNMQSTSYEVDTIYFGGGTPTVMPLREIERIVRALYENFKVLKTCEMTIEANPESAYTNIVGDIRWVDEDTDEDDDGRISSSVVTYDEEEDN